MFQLPHQIVTALPPSSMDKTAPVFQSQNATNCKLPTSKVQAKASAANDCKPGIPVADDNSASTYKDIDPTEQKSKLFGKRKSLGSLFPEKQAKKEEKSRGSLEKKTKIDDKQEEKTSILSKSQVCWISKGRLSGKKLCNFLKNSAMYSCSSQEIKL